MSRPGNFDQAAFQKRIDDAIGTGPNGRPLMKLAWAPEEFRWMPHRMGVEPPGYTYPIFCSGKVDGKFTAPERWVVLERIERPQYEHGWEAKRYINWRGSIWDVKGPCPDEKYIELRCHSYHDGLCCPCIGMECVCGEKYDHCWGLYAEPDEGLLHWIRKTAWEARQDADVKPMEDERTFTAPNAQRELESRAIAEQETETQPTEFDRDITDYWVNQPHSVTSSTTSST